MKKDKMPTSSQILKDRVEACKVFYNERTKLKGFIPGLKAKLTELYPEYDTSIGETRIRNVLQGRATDIQLTKAIELLTAEYLNANKTLPTSMPVNSKAGVAAPAL